MGFKIDNVEWTPGTTSDHVEAIIAYINNKLQEEGVTDESGNIIQLQSNSANALYLLGLGDASRFAENDQKLSQAINSFNIELCDDQQIENLLPIAAMTRNPGSASTVLLTVTAQEDGTCTIPAGTRAPFKEYYFVTKTDSVISAGTTQKIEAVCDTVGPIVALAGEINSFEESIANLESVRNEVSSNPGVKPETTNELRQRLIVGDTIKYSLDGCKNALEEQTGITYARVYFNYNTDEPIILAGGVEVAPRHAYIVIYGDSDKIAEIYTSYMSAETQNDADASKYTTIKVNVMCDEGAEESVTISANTEITAAGEVFKNATAKTIAPGEIEQIVFTSVNEGSFLVAANTIEDFDTPITDAQIVSNEASEPSRVHSQIWTTASGQEVEIKYDDAYEEQVHVRVYIAEETDLTQQVENQIKRDLIKASASWTIGQHVTSLLTGAPLSNIDYAKVAYTKVSEDGTTWSDHLITGCNVIPTVNDATIEVVSVSEE